MSEDEKLRTYPYAVMFEEFCRRVMEDNMAGPELRYFCRPFYNEFARRIKHGDRTGSKEVMD